MAVWPWSTSSSSSASEAGGHVYNVHHNTSRLPLHKGAQHHTKPPDIAPIMPLALVQWIMQVRRSLGTRHTIECSGDARAKDHVVRALEFGYDALLNVPEVYRQCQQRTVASLTICSGRYPLYFFVPRRIVDAA